MKKSVYCLLVLILFSGSHFAQKGECKHKEMDFWVGEWEVYSNRTNNKIGTNEIKPIVEGCALQENWSDILGFRGTSFTLYSEKHKAWKQTWVDNTGDITEFTGVMKDNQIIFITAPVLYKDGKIGIKRMTIVKKSSDELIQKGEESFDNMTTWEPMYDLTYKRKKN